MSFSSVLLPRRLYRPLTAMLLLLFVLPTVLSAAVLKRDGDTWATARRDATGLAPDPAATPEAVLQVYAARTFGWRGAFGVHTWIAVKPAGAAAYTRYEVMGWGVDRGAAAVRVNRMGPDNYWFGSMPEVILDRRGEGVDALIAEVQEAVRSYPYQHAYTLWPGPNSNTFLAHIGRSVPGLGLALPGNAVGKDFLPGGALLAAAPSGTGFQVSLLGLLGVLVALEEGVEVNLLGLTFGIDLNDAALALPGLGRFAPWHGEIVVAPQDGVD